MIEVNWGRSNPLATGDTSKVLVDWRSPYPDPRPLKIVIFAVNGSTTLPVGGIDNRPTLIAKVQWGSGGAQHEVGNIDVGTSTTICVSGSFVRVSVDYSGIAGLVAPTILAGAHISESSQSVDRPSITVSRSELANAATATFLRPDYAKFVRPMGTYAAAGVIRLQQQDAAAVAETTTDYSQTTPLNREPLLNQTRQVLLSNLTGAILARYHLYWELAL